MDGMTPPLCEAARVVVMDEADRVLLLAYAEGGGFWATPGGSLDPGEDHDTAARRELQEELGVDDIELGPQLAERSQVHPVGGRPAHQVERYYLARLDPAAVDPARATETLPFRWRVSLRRLILPISGSGRTRTVGVAASAREDQGREPGSRLRRATAKSMGISADSVRVSPTSSAVQPITAGPNRMPA